MKTHQEAVAFVRALDQPRAINKARSKSKSKRSGITSSSHPWPCVILAVDAANSSGWSIWYRGKYQLSGELDTRKVAECSDVVLMATQLAKGEHLLCVLVLEWSSWGGRGIRTAQGLAAAAERWLIPWRQFAEGNKARIVRVNVATWRSRVLGENARGEHDEVRRAERFTASSLTVRFGARGEAKAPNQLGSDEAPAICIGYWGSFAGEIGKKLTRSKREATLMGGMKA